MNELNQLGYSIIQNVYSNSEIEQILQVINSINPSENNFRKSEDLFAIRQFLNEIPETFDCIFNDNLRTIIREIFGDDYFVVKSIYFDKPASSNWYVAYHQDLTISVDNKIELENYGPWTKKHNQFAVQPPIEILENISTIRIHLDDTDENNGALNVIPKSHLKKIYRPETIDWKCEKEVSCAVEKGGIMLMKPLTLHSSKRTTKTPRSKRQKKRGYSTRQSSNFQFEIAQRSRGQKWKMY